MIHVSANRGRDLRATLNLHRSNLIVAPAHGLQRGVVIVYLPLASHEVLLLKQHHLGLLVVLCARDARKDKFSLSHETKTGTSYIVLAMMMLIYYTVNCNMICVLKPNLSVGYCYIPEEDQMLLL